MYTLFLSLIILTSVLLVLIVLAQNSKGGGLSSQFGGSGASNFIGVKKTGDLLERLTWGLAIALMVLSLSVNLKTFTATKSKSNDLLENINDQQSVPLNDLKPLDSSIKK